MRGKPMISNYYSGARFGKWTLIKWYPGKKDVRGRWSCRCSCGTLAKRTTPSFHGKPDAGCKKCAVMPKRGQSSRRIILEPGTRFGKWTVVEWDLARPHERQGKWLLRCDCGNPGRAGYQSLRSGETRQCVSCARRSTTKHGGARSTGYSAEYKRWVAMKNRCAGGKGTTFYKYYKGKGIKVCNRWLGSCGFKHFVEDMGLCPGPKFQLGRKNGKKGYSPGNCRWETIEQQANNKSSSRFITFRGETMTVAQWSRKCGVSTSAMHRRLTHKWPLSVALTRPTELNALRSENRFLRKELQKLGWVDPAAKDKS